MLGFLIFFFISTVLACRVLLKTTFSFSFSFYVAGNLVSSYILLLNFCSQIHAKSFVSCGKEMPAFWCVCSLAVELKFLLLCHLEVNSVEI